MTRDEIIKMAREAGAEVTDYINYHYDEDMVLFGPDEIARFAALVAAAEREACARLVDCVNNYDKSMTASNCAAAIRARGEK